jgi:hypothetical protein
MLEGDGGSWIRTSTIPTTVASDLATKFDPLRYIFVVRDYGLQRRNPVEVRIQSCVVFRTLDIEPSRALGILRREPSDLHRPHRIDIPERFRP